MAKSLPPGKRSETRRELSIYSGRATLHNRLAAVAPALYGLPGLRLERHQLVIPPLVFKLENGLACHIEQGLGQLGRHRPRGDQIPDDIDDARVYDETRLLRGSGHATQYARAEWPSTWEFLRAQLG